jgi:hypothetical protein
MQKYLKINVIDSFYDLNEQTKEDAWIYNYSSINC